MRRAAAAMLVIAACSGPGEGGRVPAPRAQAPTPAAVAPVVEAAPVAPAVDADDVIALGQRMQVALRARIPPPPDESDGSDVFDLPVHGACERPTAAERARLVRTLRAWTLRASPGYYRAEGALGSLGLGCVEPDGVVASVFADLTRRGTGDRRIGRSWVVRVRGRAVQVLAHEQGCALDDCMEWSAIAGVSVLVLADLDRDGDLDPVVLRDAHEGGAPAEGDIEVDGRKLGHQHASLELAPLQPPPGDGVVVLALDDEDGFGPHYRCVTAGVPAWTACPAAERAARHTAALAVAAEMIEHPGLFLIDRDRLAAALALLDDPPEGAALLAAADPSSLDEVVAGFAAARLAGLQALTPDERQAAQRATAAGHAGALRDALGDAACPAPGVAEQRTALATLARWVSRRERGTRPPELAAACVGPHGAYWFVRWSRGWPATPVQRAGLFFVAGRDVRLLVDGAAELQDSEDGYLPSDEGADLTVKLSRRGDSIAGLVAVAGGELVAVWDGAVSGRRPGAARLDWNLVEARVYEAMTADSLARSTDRGDVVTYWHAGPDGPTAVATFALPTLVSPPTATAGAAALLEAIERRQVADRWLDRLPAIDATTRADALAVLRLLGASPALLAHAEAAPLR